MRQLDNTPATAVLTPPLVAKRISMIACRDYQLHHKGVVGKEIDSKFSMAGVAGAVPLENIEVGNGEKPHPEPDTGSSATTSASAVIALVLIAVVVCIIVFVVGDDDKSASSSATSTTPAYYMNAAVSLAGVTTAQFNDAAKASFKITVSCSLPSTPPCITPPPPHERPAAMRTSF